MWAAKWAAPSSSPEPDVYSVYEALPCPSTSTSGQRPPTGSCAAPSGGQSIEETTGTTDRKAAEAIRIQREKELLDRALTVRGSPSLLLKQRLTTSSTGAAAATAGRNVFYGSWPLAGSTLLHKIGQDEIDRAAMKLYPNAGPGTRNRQALRTDGSDPETRSEERMVRDPSSAPPCRSPRESCAGSNPKKLDRLIDAGALHLRPLVIFLIYTGARAGEAVWLDWSNVVFGKSSSNLPNRQRTECLAVFRYTGAYAKLLNGSNQRSGPVFLTHKGQPYGAPSKEDDADTSAGSRISSAFFTACKRAGLCWTASTRTAIPSSRRT